MGNNQTSVILWVWAVPGGFGAIPKGGGRSPPPFGMVLKPPGTAQTHTMTYFWLFTPRPSPLLSTPYIVLLIVVLWFSALIHTLPAPVASLCFRSASLLTEASLSAVHWQFVIRKDRLKTP